MKWTTSIGEITWKCVFKPLLVADALVFGLSLGKLFDDAPSCPFFDVQTCSHVLLPEACRVGCQHANFVLAALAVGVLIKVWFVLKPKRNTR